MPKRTYQPNKRKRATTHGFLVRSASKSGKNVLKARRRKGRAKLSVQSYTIDSMLSKKQRLKRGDFNRFFSSGKKINRPEFTVVHTPHPTFHASVGVSKKVGRTAVKRNKLRRQIYDILRVAHKENKMGGVYIFIAKPNINQLSHPTLKEKIIKSIN